MPAAMNRNITVDDIINCKGVAYFAYPNAVGTLPKYDIRELPIDNDGDTIVICGADMNMNLSLTAPIDLREWTEKDWKKYDKYLKKCHKLYPEIFGKQNVGLSIKKSRNKQKMSVFFVNKDYILK